MTSFGRSGSNRKQAGTLEGSGLTRETQALLEDVLKKRGLSLRAAQDVASSMQGGNSQWVNTLSTRTATYMQPASKANAPVKAPTYKHHGHSPTNANLLPIASFSGKRMKHQMPAAERDMWTGTAPGPDREAIKQQCAQVMELGSAAAVREHEAQLAAMAEAQAAAAAQHKPSNPREAMVDQLVQEVKERSDFLDAMKAAGRGKEYESKIRAEIQERLHLLKQHGVDTAVGPQQWKRIAKVPAPWERQPQGQQR